MSEVINRPDAVRIGERAAELLAEIKRDIEFDRLVASSQLYADCWATFTGYPIIAEWNHDTDKAPLFQEGLKVLALKAAVWEATDGDEAAAELDVAAPVDEMVHAILAQTNLLHRLAERLGISVVHMTDQEEFVWESGDYTQDCYEAAGWGTPPERYWIGASETRRRHQILDAAYARIGIGPQGRSHGFTFEARDELASA
jgi:hypothetical protein